MRIPIFKAISISWNVIRCHNGFVHIAHTDFLFLEIWTQKSQVEVDSEKKKKKHPHDGGEKILQ